MSTEYGYLLVPALIEEEMGLTVFFDFFFFPLSFCIFMSLPIELSTEGRSFGFEELSIVSKPKVFRILPSLLLPLRASLRLVDICSLQETIVLVRLARARSINGTTNFLEQSISAEKHVHVFR